MVMLRCKVVVVKFTEIHLVNIFHYEGCAATRWHLARAIGPSLNSERDSKTGSHQVGIKILAPTSVLCKGSELDSCNTRQLNRGEERGLSYVLPLGCSQHGWEAGQPARFVCGVDERVVVLQLRSNRVQAEKKREVRSDGS